MIKFFPFLFSFILFTSCSNAQSKSPTFEFRGVWVASVKNCDWPSDKNLTTEDQKAEFINLANMHQRNGMNALIVQVRPSADALFNSPYEPWSEYLTGRQGVAPNPYYDPLEFMVQETHKRGMEFHAWLNPYRAVFNIKEGGIAKDHITKTKPHWFINYAGKKYFNPALQEVRDHFIKIVVDIITRYKVDGIHIDDYFYPYPDNQNHDFPDDKYYRQMGNGLSKADWRRSNCDSIIYQMWRAINMQPRRVKFGVSPFGVWRNNTQDPMGSNTKAGINNYDYIYADILLWLKKGWMDYCVPQLYWEINHHLCDYNTLLDWWNKNTYRSQLYIGHGIYNANTTRGWRDKNELPNQIKNLRQYKTTLGSVFFSSKNFNNNVNGWCDSLQYNYYSNPALIPPMAWIDNEKPGNPIVTTDDNNIFNIYYDGKKAIKSYALFTGKSSNDLQLKKILPFSKATTINMSKLEHATNEMVFVASVSINNNISELVEVK